MTGDNRLEGGQVFRQKMLSFRFDGKNYTGFAGDTLASALLAHGVRLMGRSFKYHRPRGPFSAGSEEPNALVELRTGPRKEPNSRATTTELFDGLVANSQNRWPSLAVDILAINDILWRFLSAGFYYKTFMWPAAFWEKLYEPMIRRAAGLGQLSWEHDPDFYDRAFHHCDLLIIGAGPAGLMAALSAGRAKAEVVLADEDFRLGGRLNSETLVIDDVPATHWVEKTLAELASMPNVRIMKRTTVIGGFDHGIYAAIERVSDHHPVPEFGQPRQRFWRLYCRSALLCSGAIERPIAFHNNDRPGIMLAGAIRSYVNRFAVTPDKTVALYTNNDSAYRTAHDLAAKGVAVAAIIDTRANTPPCNDFRVFKGAHIVNSKGYFGLKKIHIKDSNGHCHHIKCGAVGVSGGWNPTLHLACHGQHRPQWQHDIAAFIPPASLPTGLWVAGAATGMFSTHQALKSGAEQALKALDSQASPPPIPQAEDAPMAQHAFFYVKGSKRAWIDQQNDVTTKDVILSHQEGFRAVEHLKRYTTLGMATDQGKTANVIGLAVMADQLGQPIEKAGTTMYRPPYTAVSIGALAGRMREQNYRPTRHTPSHFWAKEQGAVFVEVGQWLRAGWFPLPTDTNWRQAVDREVRKTRASVGVCDCSTFGKIDVQGRDAAQFLNFVYCNAFAKLAIGKVRYGLMLREDGIAMDDGTVARFAPDHFVVTTTTANAVTVYQHMEFVRQCLYPDMDVQVISITESWAQYAIAGPQARNLLQKIIDPEYPIDNANFPFMACGEITLCGGLKGRLFRISFSGELAYEIAVPTRYGDALMREIMMAGEAFDITPYGTEALSVMRIEKGHPAGNEFNGTTSAHNLGLGGLISAKKDCIGWVLSQRDGLTAKDSFRLVGVKPCDPSAEMFAGAHLMDKKGPIDADHDQGYITSCAFSPSLESYIGLALIKRGHDRIGEKMRLVSPVNKVSFAVEITPPCFIDPKGERLRA